MNCQFLFSFLKAQYYYYNAMILVVLLSLFWKKILYTEFFTSWLYCTECIGYLFYIFWWCSSCLLYSSGRCSIVVWWLNKWAQKLDCLARILILPIMNFMALGKLFNSFVLYRVIIRTK